MYSGGMHDSQGLERQIVVRVDDDLYAKLEADAEANERSISQSVRYFLRLALRAKGN